MNIPLIDQSFVKEKGIFYVGGSLHGEGSDHYYANQMFVEVYVPYEIRHPYPVIMFHGAGQTNVNWLITPDGRMGWADYFVSQGYVVYLAEQPARARSAWHPQVNGPTMHHTAEVLQNRFMTAAGSWPQAKLHTQWPGGGEDLNSEISRQFLQSQVEYLPSNKDSQELVLQAGKELLEKTGPAILLTHSQAGPFGWFLRDYYPEYVKGIISLEPTAPPFSRDMTKPAARDYGLASVPLHYEPPVNSPEDFELELLKSDREDIPDGWVMKEPARKLPRLAGVPILLITSEASYHAQSDHLVSYLLNQCGVQHDFIRLEEAGIHGNGHMMMLEKNNLEIADLVISWLEKQDL